MLILDSLHVMSRDFQVKSKSAGGRVIYKISVKFEIVCSGNCAFDDVISKLSKVQQLSCKRFILSFCPGVIMELCRILFSFLDIFNSRQLGGIILHKIPLNLPVKQFDASQIYQN